jgi:cytochrome c2
MAAAMALAACGGGLPVATPADATRGGVQLADLQNGRSLVASKCSGCHHTPMPADHSTGEWPHMLEEMAARAHVDSSQRRVMQEYLVTMAATPAQH